MDPSPVVLEGSLARLEPLREDHLPALIAIGLDPELWRWTVASVRTPEDMRHYVRVALDLAERGEALPFVTIEKSTMRVAGSTRFGNIDRANRRVEIGWTWLGREFQRTGINTEVKYLMLRHAFEVMQCLRVELKTDALNLQSRTAIERIGAREEGTLRSHMVTETGRIRDTVYYSILADEWPTVRRWFEARLG
jgi:RimJ/RimL family protein N-acetyltransferase